MNKLTLLLVASATLLGACTTNPMFQGPGGGDIEPFPMGPGYSEQTAVQGRMAGALPGVTSFDTDGEGWGGAENGYTHAMIEARSGEFGWAMLMVDVEDSDGDGIYEYAEVIGCGEYQDGYFDGPADDHDIVIEETIIDGEPMLAIDVDARFGSDDVAAVIYVPNEG